MGKSRSDQLSGDPYGVVELLLQQLLQTGGPVALEAKRLEKDYLQLTKLKVNPECYATAQSFRWDYQIAKLLSKYPGLADEESLLEEAKRGFAAAEEQCRKTNQHLSSGRPTGAESVLWYARRKIARILGRLDLSEVLARCEWGPGATATLRAQDATVDEKVREFPISVSGRALGLARAVLESDLHWVRARFSTTHDDPDVVIGPCSFLRGEYRIVDSCRMTTVPKDSKTDRTIGIEPTLNIFLQKGVGKVLRKKLKDEGIDLDDQSINQAMARDARRLGLATLDLSRASDSVCTELVRILLPPEWFELMDSLRSHFYDWGEGPRRLEKFSSMGNGFTFELESLIFYAIAYATAEDLDRVSYLQVYGDDIIVSNVIAGRLISVLSEIGFTVNADKSFVEGDFFESCGKHFFSEVEVTPMYQKEPVSDLPSLIRFHNRVLRTAMMAGYGLWLHSLFRPVIVEVRRVITSLCESLRRDAIRRATSKKHLRLAKMIRFPQIPFGVEGDDGCWALSRLPSDRDGILACPVLQTRAVTRSGDMLALLCTDLRRRRDPFEPDRCGSGRWWITDSTAFGGRVSPRGQTRYRWALRRVYDNGREPLNWL